MYYLSFFRKTALFGFISFVVSICTSLISIKEIFPYCIHPQNISEFFIAYISWSVPLYILLTIIHIVRRKISKDFGKPIAIFFSLLWTDITTPFRSIWMFLLIIKRKHIIKDDSKFHACQDLVEVLGGFLWTVALGGFIAFGFISLI